MRSTRIGCALAVGAMVLLSACSRGGSEKNSAGAAATATTSPGADAVAKVAKAPKGQPLGTPRQVVYTANLQVRVDELARASARAMAIVSRAGGYLFSQDANLTGHTDETLVFKVPPQQFEPTLGQLGDLGTALDQNVSTADVTDQVVDLQGRLRTATASVARLRALFAGAVNVPDIVAIETQLETRESEVESLQGQLRLAQSQVQLATVTLELTTKAPSHKTTTPGFTTALAGGWGAFVDAGKVALAVVGATLPFLALVAVVALIVVGVRRRRLTLRVRVE